MTCIRFGGFGRNPSQSLQWDAPVVTRGVWGRGGPSSKRIFIGALLSEVTIIEAIFKNHAYWAKCA
jgi:hypothetical protein